MMDPAAKARTDARFERLSRTTLSRGNCYERWAELWRTKDGSPANAEDVRDFYAQPRGQEHTVRAEGSSIFLTCACDSGD